MKRVFLAKPCLFHAVLALLVCALACSSSAGPADPNGDPGSVAKEGDSDARASAPTSGHEGDVARGTGNTSDNDSGADAHTSAVDDSDAGACVDIVLTAADLACMADSDCSSVVVGEVCPGWVPNEPDGKLGTVCYDGAANSAGAARVATILATVPHGEDAGLDFCDQAARTWAIKCVAGQCVQCAFSDAGACKGGDTSTDASGS
jgi:hypothetical protein